MMSDVDAMCNSLANRGLPVEDLVIGTAVAQAMMAFTQFQTLMDNRRFDMGEIKPQLRYPGATWMGRIRTPGGYELEVWSIRETYESDSGVTTLYFPTDSAMVTAPNCGHLMYGQITQIEYGSTEYSTFAATRVPKFIVKQENDTRKLRLASRPLAAPKTYSPWIYAADVV
jgi:hypothetical protein